MCYGGDCPDTSHYAEGGSVESGKSRADHEWGINRGFGGAGHESGTSDMGLDVRGKEYGAAKSDAKNILKQMQWQKGQDRKNLAEGGDASDDEMHPMVSKVMMSRGGMISNDDEPEANSMPAEFDDLALDDHLEGTNSGFADGDEIGDSQEDDDRHDIVARILSSRKKKDRMPRPA